MCLKEGQCCFCFGGLRFGSSVIAVIHLCKSLGFILYLIFMLSQKNTIIRESDVPLLTGVSTAAIVCLVGDIFLLIGIFKRNQKFFIPWLVIEILQCLSIVGSILLYLFIILSLSGANARNVKEFGGCLLLLIFEFHTEHEDIRRQRVLPGMFRENGCRFYCLGIGLSLSIVLCKPPARVVKESFVEMGVNHNGSEIRLCND